VFDRDATLGHHLFQDPEAEAVGEIPAGAQQDHRAIEMTAFEHHAFPELTEGIDRTELLMGLRQFPFTCRIAKVLSKHLNGYDAAPWGIDERVPTTAH
jgi:hypothetical protein